jgi:putative membrane protein
VALILGVVSMYVEPVVKFFSIPFIILTIGLFLLVINALMLMLTAWIAGQAGIGFHVEGFWTAVWGSLVITLVNAFIDVAVLEDDD